jgi:Na+/melibiose symporter-like transporter
MLLSAPVLMVSLYMVYQAPQGAGQGYLVGWLLAMYVGMSLLMLSAHSWAAVLAPSYEDRSRIFGAMAGVGVLGAILVLAIPIFMARRGHSEVEGLRAVGWFLMVSTPIMIAIAAFRTRERITDVGHKERYRLADYLALLRHRNIWRLLACDLFTTMGPGWMSALYFFFFVDSRGFTLTQANLLLLIYIVAGLAGAPASAWLANRISKHRAMMVTTAAYSAMLVLLFILPKADMAWAVPTMFVAGALSAGFEVIMRAMTADIGDEIRLQGGRQQIGLIYALTNATGKLGTAISIWLTFTVLATVGYNAREGAVNTASAIRGLELAYAVGPIVFVLLGGLVFVGYKLDAKRHAQIREELDARDAAALLGAEGDLPSPSAAAAAAQ